MITRNCIRCIGYHNYYTLMRRRPFLLAVVAIIVVLAMVYHLTPDNKRRVNIFVLEEHHEALLYWHHMAVTNRLDRKGNTLIHIDGHSDMAPPEYIDGFPLFSWPNGEPELFTMLQKNDVFIQGAIMMGMINHVIWIYPAWDKSEDMLSNGDYGAYNFEIGYMNKSKPNGDLEIIFCECRTALNKLTHKMAADADTECMYLDESKPMQDAEVKIKRAECLKPVSVLVEIIVDEYALEIMQRDAWVTKPSNVILDIDEDFFGCDRGGKALEQTGIAWYKVDRIDELLSLLFCPKNVLMEEKADVLMKDFLASFIKKCHLSGNKCNAFSDVSKQMVRELVGQINKFPRMFCQNEANSENVLHEIVTALSQLTLEQLKIVTDLGFCLSLSPATFGFDQGRSSFRICHGANTPNETLVVLYTPEEEIVNDRMHLLHGILQHVTDMAPKVVTLCRSIRDGYTPRHLFTKIERGIIDFFSQSQNKFLYNVIYDDNLLGGSEGWDSRYKATL